MRLCWLLACVTTAAVLGQEQEQQPEQSEQQPGDKKVISWSAEEIPEDWPHPYVKRKKLVPDGLVGKHTTGRSEKPSKGPASKTEKKFEEPVNKHGDKCMFSSECKNAKYMACYCDKMTFIDMVLEREAESQPSELAYEQSQWKSPRWSKPGPPLQLAEERTCLSETQRAWDTAFDIKGPGWNFHDLPGCCVGECGQALILEVLNATEKKEGDEHNTSIDNFGFEKRPMVEQPPFKPSPVTSTKTTENIDNLGWEVLAVAPKPKKQATWKTMANTKPVKLPPQPKAKSRKVSDEDTKSKGSFFGDAAKKGETDKSETSESSTSTDKITGTSGSSESTTANENANENEGKSREETKEGEDSSSATGNHSDTSVSESSKKSSSSADSSEEEEEQQKQKLQPVDEEDDGPDPAEAAKASYENIQAVKPPPPGAPEPRKPWDCNMDTDQRWPEHGTPCAKDKGYLYDNSMSEGGKLNACKRVRDALNTSMRLRPTTKSNNFHLDESEYSNHLVAVDPASLKAALTAAQALERDTQQGAKRMSRRWPIRVH